MDVAKKNIVISLSMAIILSFLTYWYFKEGVKNLSPLKLPKLEVPKLEFSPKKTGYKEFGTPDGDLKLKYPADWLEMPKDVFGTLPQAEISGGKGEVIFFTGKIDWQKTFIYILLVQKLVYEKEKNLEEVLADMTQKALQKEEVMELIQVNKGEKVIVFEAIYRTKDGKSFHSLEKILSNKKVYLVSILSFEKEWEGVKEEAKEIIDSVQLVK